MKREYSSSCRNKVDAIAEEMFELRKKYGFDRRTVLTWSNIYVCFDDMKVGSITKNVDFLMKTLEIIGFDDEQKIDYLEHNREIVTTEPKNLRQICIVLQNFGLLRNALLKCPSLLCRSTLTKGINVRDFYALLCVEDINDIQYLKNELNKMSLTKRAELRRTFWLDEDKLREMSAVFNRALRVSRGLRLDK